MNRDQEARDRRNYVSNMYPYFGWHEKVAGMSTDQITAIYLRAIRDENKPKAPPETPDIPEDKEDPGEQFRLF